MAVMTKVILEGAAPSVPMTLLGGIFLLLFLILLLTVILLTRQSHMSRDLSVDIDQDIDDIAESVAKMSGQLEADRRSNAEFNARLRESVENSLRNGMKAQYTALGETSEKQMQKLHEFSGMQESAVRIMIEENSRQKEEMMEFLRAETERMSERNEKRLDMIEDAVTKKLDISLNERLDASFKNVGDQLSRLYMSLGELKDLSSGVQDLNRTLANVKTRGTFGEVQLGRILEETLTRNQYEVNVVTKRNSNDRVEYAVKMPGLSEDDPVLLPIDAKFPSDLYNSIIEASEAADPAALSGAVSALRSRILTEARTIRDKYLDPPRTTNYAIMFLPTEGLYAEVLRIDALTETCQRMGVIVTGPTTVTAVLNALSAGFRNVQLSKKSVEIMKLLEAVKTQFGKMDDEVARTRKKLDEAAGAADELRRRTGIIRKRMKKIGELDEGEAERLLFAEEEPEEIQQEEEE